VFGLRFTARIEKNLAAKTKLSIRLHLWVRNQSVKRKPISQSTNNTVARQPFGPSFTPKLGPFVHILAVLRIRIRDPVLF
jgi:hypothetical protein